MSDMPERILAWREEDEYIDHVLINKCWGETSEVPSWDATEYVRADRIAALKAQLAEKDEQLVSVLRREAATYERHDAKMEAAEAERDALRERVEKLGRDLNVARYGQPDFSWAVHKEAMSALRAKVARLEGALDAIADPQKLRSYGDPGILRDFARAALADGGTAVTAPAVSQPVRYCLICDIADCATHRPVQDDAASRRRKIMGHMDDKAAADARAEALLKRAAQMAYEVWDDPEALSKAILALITETKP